MQKVNEWGSGEFRPEGTLAGGFRHRNISKSFASLAALKGVALFTVLDMASSGPLYLRMPAVAAVVQNAIMYRDGREYELHAYVVMPNHVHLLVTPLRELPEIMQSLKRHTAREANRILGLTGRAFLQDESYDRSVRNDMEFGRIVA